MVEADAKLSYKKSFNKALIFHASFLLALLFESVVPKATLTPSEAEETPVALSVSTSKQPEPEPIKAVSVNEQELVAKMNQIKAAREKQHQVEVERQTKLAREAENAKMARIAEQKRLVQLKQEADRIAVERKKQALLEQQRLKELEKQKAEEQKKVLALKQQQERLKKQQEDEAKRLKLEQAGLEKERIEKLRLEKEKQLKEKAAREVAERERQALEAQKMERVAGEVDKYKALIVNAISREWILPDNADSKLSSQFRIRLAPDGTVLEVSLTRTSGDSVLDRSAQTAIHKASPLPVPSDPDAFNVFRDIRLNVRPEQVRG